MRHGVQKGVHIMKKAWSAVLSVSLAATVLAGCGASGSGATASDSTSTASSESAGAAGTTAAAASTTSGTASADDAGTLHIAWTADAQTLDVQTTSADYGIPMNVYDRLFEIKLNDDGSTQLVNSLVKDYTVSDDGLTYNFTLRDDVKFSDGTPLTANDVAFSLIRLLGLDTSVNTDFASCIKGADDYIAKEGYSYDDTLEGIQVTDDTHLTITLAYPFAGFLYELATPPCSIYSKAAVEAAGDDYGNDYKSAIGSGPYMLTDWTRDSSIELTQNPNYWGDTPSVKNVDIQIVPDASTISMMFQNGQLDILDCDILDSSVVESTYKTQYADKIVSANRLATTYFIMNENNEYLKDVNVRKAIQMAIDRQSILDTVYSGEGNLCDGIYPKGLIGYSEDNQGWLKYDPDGAKKLLEDAGYKDGDISFEIATDSSDSANTSLVVQMIQANLQAVGINTEIKSYDEASWLALRKSGEMASFVGTWTADFNDPDNFIYTFFGTDDKTKIRSINYKDEDVMKRIQDARAITDDDKRIAEYDALEKKVVEDDAAWVPLFGRTHLFVTGDRVKKYVPHWAGYGDFFINEVELAD